MRGIILALFMFSFACKAVKIGISKPAAQANITEQMNVTTTEATTPLTNTPSTTAAPKVQNTTPSTAQTSTTTTVAPSTTTTAPTSAYSESTLVPKNGSTSKMRCQDRGCSEAFCACNLRHGVCDVDCCCDVDCTSEELKTVECVQNRGGFDDFYYQMTLPPCDVDNGYLCVFRSNFHNNLIKDVKIDFDSPAINDWPSVLLEGRDPPEEQSFYKIDDPVVLLSLETNEIVEFDVPFSLTGQHCQTEEPVRHLRSKKTSCFIPLEKAQTMEGNLYGKLFTSLLLQRPNIKVPVNRIIKQSQLEFLSINLFRCTSEGGCRIASIFNSSLDVFDDLEYSSRIDVKIYHNITDLLACDVFFRQGEQRSENVWQHFEVSFIRANETDEVLPYVSGPLGYNQGGPLIVAHKIMLNESNSVLSYFHSNRTKPIHIHPPRCRRNSCERSQETVNFGESILVQCSVQLDNSTELNSETNFTRVCAELQNRSLEVLAGIEILRLQEEFFISELGYPVDEVNHWVGIVVKNYEQLPVVGVYLDKEYGFLCQNMILGLKYEFLTLTETVNGNPHQSLVKRASIDVGKRHDLQFQLEEPISVPLTFSVIFRDPRETSGSAEVHLSWWIFLVLVNLIGINLVY